MSAPAPPLTSLIPAPRNALDERGRPRWGIFAGEVRDAASVAGSGGGLISLARTKRWVFVWTIGPRAAIGLAVADVGYIGQTFAFVHERAGAVGAPPGGGPPREEGWTAPLGVGCRVSGALSNLHALALGVGGRRTEIRAEGRGLRCQARLGSIRADYRVEALDTPITAITDLGERNPAATIKSAGVPVTGWLEVDGRRIDLEGSFATVDWSCGRFPYRMAWNWGALGALDARGRRIGLNLCRGVHEDRAGRHTENALWIEGVPAPLPPVRFEVGAAGGDPWRIRSADGAVDLEVRPFTERRAEVRLGVVASSFRHPLGTYHGRARDLDGRAVELDGAPGMVEDHTARW